MGANAPIEAAAAASAPFVLEACAHKLDSGFSRVYQRRLLRDLKQMVCRKYPPLVAPEGVDLLAMRRARNFIEFDDAYPAPLPGFRDEIGRASCRERVCQYV